MKIKSEEKLQNKIIKCFENQAFYSSFEDAVESVQNYFITGGILVGGAGIVLGIIPPGILMGCLVSIFAPLISVSFSRMMQQFYKDRGEYLKEKLEKLKDEQYNASKQEKPLTQNLAKEETNFIKNKIKENKTQKNKQKQKNTYHNNEESKDDGLNR